MKIGQNSIKGCLLFDGNGRIEFAVNNKLTLYSRKNYFFMKEWNNFHKNIFQARFSVYKFYKNGERIDEI